MKVIVNACFGGFSLSDFAVNALDLESAYDSISRTDPRLIELFERYGSERLSGTCADLAIVVIPDAATDWMITDYDGSEDVIYVLDGKLHYAQ